MAKVSIKDRRTEVDEKLRDQWERTGKLKPVDLLHLLKESLSASALDYHFGYHNSFVSCTTYLKGLKMGVEKWPQYSGLQGDLPMYKLVDEIFWQVATATQSHQNVTKTLFFIEEEGSVCLHLARKCLQSQYHGGCDRQCAIIEDRN